MTLAGACSIGSCRRRQPAAVVFNAQGPVVTPELQEVFGQYGKVVGVVSSPGSVAVTYETFGTIRFVATLSASHDH